MLVIDGSLGEGGGQILRTALTLSMITGQGFRLKNIRAKRKKPGLMRQHLACVLAAQQICPVDLEGADVGSTELSFSPQGAVQAKDILVSIGSAGSTGLIFQTLFPALALSQGPSSLTIQGGTHNPLAPCFDFLHSSYLPLANKMGFGGQATIHQHGFYPAGGGEVRFNILPSNSFNPLTLTQRGALKSLKAEIILSGLYPGVGKAEAEHLQRTLPELESIHHLTVQHPKGPGNAVLIYTQFEQHTCVFSAIGERNISSEAVVENVVDQAQAHLLSASAIDPHLADQIVLLMALGQGGSFTTSLITDHFKTQVDLLGKFLSRSIQSKKLGENCFRVEVN